MKIYYYEGMKPWNSSKKTISGKTGSEIFLFCVLFLLFDFNNFGMSFDFWDEKSLGFLHLSHGKSVKITMKSKPVDLIIIKNCTWGRGR